MNLHTLISVYHHDETESQNPLIKVHLITTDDEKAKANYEAMVAKSVSEGWSPANEYAGNQAELKKKGSHLTIRNHFNTHPVEMSIGEPNW